MCGAPGRVRRRPDALDPELRRRSHVGLNKGAQQNALRRAVFFNRLGEIRDRSYENQRHRASGLNLLVAAIILYSAGSTSILPAITTGKHRRPSVQINFGRSAPGHITPPQPLSVL